MPRKPAEPRKPADVGQLKLRLPDALRRKLERASDKSGRSLNNEIVWRLSQSLGPEGEPLFDLHMERENEVEQEVSKALDRLIHDPEFYKRIAQQVADQEAVRSRKKRGED
jgi:hypothetical protein